MRDRRPSDVGDERASHSRRVQSRDVRRRSLADRSAPASGSATISRIASAAASTSGSAHCAVGRVRVAALPHTDRSYGTSRLFVSSMNSRLPSTRSRSPAYRGPSPRRDAGRTLGAMQRHVRVARGDERLLFVTRDGTRRGSGRWCAPAAACDRFQLARMRLPADRLDHEMGRIQARGRPAERLHRRERVLPLEDAPEVEAKRKRNPRGDRAGPRQRPRVRTQGSEAGRRAPACPCSQRSRVRRMRAVRPDLVDVIGGARHIHSGQHVDLPRPDADAVPAAGRRRRRRGSGDSWSAFTQITSMSCCAPSLASGTAACCRERVFCT